ncbi:glycoside hydrolase family 2 protein [Prevotella copri]|uniref:Glycoside hydrolase family 2 protein n=1 Tax=Segatella copri TaxID=165179 RepID=A0AA90UHQ9_9BACT|nr:glycoside hydrolase family 2 TIM barrel-domain containing protein [Segatella copri]MQN14108.1 glycoside hydrolase family 2 protein [Segatella copri]
MKKIFALAILLLGAQSLSARDRQSFDKDWLFVLADSAGMQNSEYADGHWRRLNLPHDWAIEGDFSPSNPSGASGGALPGGIGWYRKHFSLSPDEKYDRFTITFDGVYMNSTVYINGHKLGTRPYGYSTFEYDLTPYIYKKGDNVIAVKVDNSDQPNSRWYSGCGIYRHVWLTKTLKEAYIPQWGQYVATTPKGDVRVKVDFHVNGSRMKLSIRNTIYDAAGKVVARSQGDQNQKLKVRKPHLWSIGKGYLYTVKSELVVNGKVVDTATTQTAFRDVRFDARKGFFLNGENMKINGVCEHHDFGCLGAALNEDALHRKLTILRDMGVNAIRSSHNPPAPELLNMCDSMGIMVMDESFDMWRRKKSNGDYARFFDEWHQRDLSDLVKRDRNHPCIIMWSIGNEVLEQWSDAAADTLSLEQANLILNAGHDASTLAHSDELSVNSLLTRHLADIVKKYDPWGARPVTAGCNEPDPKNHLFKSGAIDVIGFNYHHQWAKDVPRNFPDKPFIFSESVSALQTRGYYRMPSDSIYTAPVEWWLPYTDPSFKCSAYDNMHASWSSTHEETWDVVKHNDFVGGQFIWTGFDYIGEPTPYAYPARSSYFGIIDLAGLPKDSYYMYQSEWTKKPVLHLFPHWNWLPGQQIDMWCYYNQADEVELFINGKSQGIRKKKVHGEGNEGKAHAVSAKAGDFDRSTEYHVMWRVTFEPGEVKVVARKQGREISSQTIKTAGPPHHLVLKKTYQNTLASAVQTPSGVPADLQSCTPTPSGVPADLQSAVKKGSASLPGDLQSPSIPTTFVEVNVVDKDGNLCPNAENEIYFSSTAEILGTDNGNQTSLERFTDPKRKAFFGKCIIVLRGHGTLRAESIDLQQAIIKI